MIILESFISMFWDIAPIIGMILIFQLFIIKYTFLYISPSTIQLVIADIV